jgi:hypothetical protein
MTILNAGIWLILGSVVLQLFFSISIGLAAMTGIALAAFAWRYVFPTIGKTPDLRLEWVCTWSADRYTPMIHLTDEADFRFLRVQPGFTAEIEERVRDQRYRMFVAYLRCLRSDFNGLATALKYILANADHDRTTLASTLLRTQVAFSWACVMASARAYAWRKGLGNVDVRQLLAVFDAIHFELRSLAPTVSAA